MTGTDASRDLLDLLSPKQTEGSLHLRQAYKEKLGGFTAAIPPSSVKLAFHPSSVKYRVGDYHPNLYTCFGAVSISQERCCPSCSLPCNCYRRISNGS